MYVASMQFAYFAFYTSVHHLSHYVTNGLTFNICHCDMLTGCSYRLRMRKEYLVVVEQCIPENILRQYTELCVVRPLTSERVA